MKVVAAAAKAKADTVSRGAHGLATETGLEITVTHLPPGTSKWNRIEHRLFSHISLNWLNWLNWRGRPLTSHEVIIETIGAVTTTTGLTVRAANATATTFEWRFTASDLDDPPPGLHRRPRTSADHLRPGPGEPAQDLVGLGGAQLQCGGVLGQLVVLLGD